MKKLLSLVLVLVFVFCLFGCGQCEHTYEDSICTKCGKEFKVGLI